MVTFASVVLAPVATGDQSNLPALQPPVPPVMDGVLDELVPPMRRMLLQRSQGDCALHRAAEATELTLPLVADAPLTLAWFPAGQTAGVAAWTCRGEVRATSVLRSGLDPAEDASALAAVTSGAGLPMSEETRRSILDARAPLLATLFVDRHSVGDRGIAVAATALEGTFFALLGVSSSDGRDKVEEV
jgi:hypothetical protein